MSDFNDNRYVITCDENGRIQDGVFKGKYFDSNACIGDAHFRKITKTMELVKSVSAYGSIIVMLLEIVYMARNRGGYDPLFMIIVMLAIILGYGAIDKVFSYIQYKEILKDAKAYRAVLYKVGTRLVGKGAVKECYFAILDGDRVRVVKEFIMHQAINRYADAKNEEGFLGFEFRVMASPDTTGYCVREKDN